MSVSDDAASPVIATILMVAIVVVLAGAVMLLINVTRDEENAPEAFGVAKDEGQDTLKVARSNPSYDWSNYEIRSKEAVSGLHYSQDVIADASDPLVSNTYQPLAGGPILAGDYISLCAEAPLSEVTIQIRDENSNGIVYETLFRSIGLCT